jgi:hypothetical protein
MAGGLAVSAATYLLVLLPAKAFDVVIEEDGFVETTGALGLLVGVVLAALALRREHRAGSHWFKQLSYAGLSVFLFLSAGEEISWGQRILGFSTPAEIGRANGQDEFNLHNLTALGSTPELVFLAAWFVLAVVIPVTAAVSPGLGVHLRRLVPVLPLPFAPLFVGAYVTYKLAQVTYHAWSGYHSIYPPVHAATEIKEMIFECLLGLAAWWLWRHGDWVPASAAAQVAAGEMPRSSPGPTAPTAPVQH